MLSPLLSSNAKNSERRFCWTEAIIFSIVALVLIGARVTSHSAIQTEEETVSVGVRMDWVDILLTYLEVATLPRTMSYGAAYKGRANPNLPLSDCGQNPVRCYDLCVARMRASREGAKATPPEPKVCFRHQNWNNHDYCWDTKKFRCWPDENGGNLVYDQRIDWHVLKHYAMWPKKAASVINELGETQVSPLVRTGRTPWLHMRSATKQIDFFIFGQADYEKIVPIAEICEEFESLRGAPVSVQTQLEKVPLDHGIVFSGHSEGTGWAICAERFMNRTGMPHQRRVIGSGPLLYQNDLELPSQSLFLMKGTQTPGFPPIGGKIMADVFTVLNLRGTGITLPQFGFTCYIPNDKQEALTCVEPQPKISVAESVEEMKKTWRTVNSKDLENLHHFKSYQACFRACFIRANGKVEVDLIPNVDTYVKESYSALGLPRSEYLQRAAASSRSPPVRPQSPRSSGESSSTSPNYANFGTRPRMPRNVNFKPEFSRPGTADEVTTWRRPIPEPSEEKKIEE